MFHVCVTRDNRSFHPWFSVRPFLIHISPDDLAFPWRYRVDALCCLPPKHNYPKHQNKFNCPAVINICTLPPPTLLCSLHPLLCAMLCYFFPLFLPRTQTTVMFVAPRGSNLQHPPRLLKKDAFRFNLRQVVQQNAVIFRYESVSWSEEIQTHPHCKFAVWNLCKAAIFLI